MAMSEFSGLCPDTASTETRALQVISGNAQVEAGLYELVELYCDDPICDCRRVILLVRSTTAAERPLAHIHFGWESVAFYTRWLSGNATLAREMRGASLEEYAEQGPGATELLTRICGAVLNDPGYVARLQRHYLQFKSALRRGPSSYRLRDVRKRREPGGRRR